YMIRLSVWDLAGNRKNDTATVLWASTADVANFEQSEDYISPNGDGIQDIFEITYETLRPVNLDFHIFNEAGQLVHTLSKVHTKGEDGSVVWDGTDGSGVVVDDGVYTVKLNEYEFRVVIDTEFPDISLLYSPIHQHVMVNPEDGLIKGVSFSVDLSGWAVDDNFSSWSLSRRVTDDPPHWVPVNG
ncbi:MAG: hypothetical protein GWN14_09350, partial [candidate division Zixibacteria bacterium]|nr:hypothetical protein [Gammaproteobacteria bacterium]NIX56115.1 hypothetical protein [candidate division Zixibacteria bacterium]